MTFVMLWVDHANVVAQFDSREDAVKSLSDFVAENPEFVEELAVLELDAQGRGVGEWIFALERPQEASQRPC